MLTAFISAGVWRLPVSLGVLLLFWNLMLRRRVAEKTANLKQALAKLQEANQATVALKDDLSATLQGHP